MFNKKVIMNAKGLHRGIIETAISAVPAGACTGVAKDGSYIQARTIEWAKGYL